jgi:hypothetical protein
MRRVATPCACTRAAVAIRGLKQMPQQQGRRQKGDAGKGKEKASQPAEQNSKSSDSKNPRNEVKADAKAKAVWATDGGHLP